MKCCAVSVRAKTSLLLGPGVKVPLAALNCAVEETSAASCRSERPAAEGN
jgi:hypothetical protein